MGLTGETWAICVLPAIPMELCAHAFPFEVALGERVVVGRMRPIVRAGNTKIGQQKRGRFGLHWGAAIGVQRELTALHIMFGDGVLKKRLKQRDAFGIGDAPADHPELVLRGECSTARACRQLRRNRIRCRHDRRPMASVHRGTVISIVVRRLNNGHERVHPSAP